MKGRRGRGLALAALVAAVLGVRDGRAEEPSVPIGLEVELLAKVAAYDRHLPERAGDRVNVVIVTMPGNPDSVRAAAQMQTALAGIPQIDGRPHDDAVVPFPGARALPDTCKQRHAAILLFTPGFGDQVDAIRAALDGVDVLSVSSVAGYVPRGIVLGFDLVSGKPKLLVNLTQARKQKVQLSADVLKLMKVYE